MPDRDASYRAKEIARPGLAAEPQLLDKGAVMLTALVNELENDQKPLPVCSLEE